MSVQNLEAWSARGTESLMKRTLALALLVVALWCLSNWLSSRSGRVKMRRLFRRDPPTFRRMRLATGAESDAMTELVTRYATEQPPVREMVARVAEKFGRNARAIERTDGLRGLVLLDRLDLEAIFLYEKHPTEFRRLRDFLGGDAAAEILLHWREYFGLKHADDTDRGILIAEIASLSPAQQRIAARYPSVLPLILADPAGVTELIEQTAGDQKDTGRHAGGPLLHQPGARVCGPPVPRCGRLDHHGPLALDAFRRHGMEGFALVSLYGPILETLGNAMPLDQSLVLLRGQRRLHR